jgi:hypothetical protein
MHITLVRNDLDDPAVMRRFEYELPDVGLSSISGALQNLSRN